MRKQKNYTKMRWAIPLSLLFISALIFSAFSIFLPNTEKSKAAETSCTTQYSAWSACNSNGLQKRTRYTTCQGSTTTSQETKTCEYVPPNFPCTSYTYSAWTTTCQNGYYTRTILTRLPSGCQEATAGSLIPELKKACTAETPICSFTYSAWGECRSDGTQARTVLTHYPTGCTGGTPEIKRSCAYTQTAPVCSFAYSAWGECQPNGTRTRIVTGTKPAGCTGGNPVTFGSCSYTAPADSNETSQPKTADQNSTQPISSDSTTDQTTAVTPPFVFTTLSNDVVIRNTVTIGGKANEARNIEFDLIPIGSNIFRYIGTAKNTAADYWEYSFNTKSFPNGYFYLVAKISNAYGSYVSSNKIRVKIENVDATGNPLPIETATVAAAPHSESDIPVNFNGLTTPEWQKKYFGSENCLDKNECRGESDPDNDGLSNNDEFRYRTDPLKPDSDGDGFLDGDEAKTGFNPLQFSPGDRSDKVVFENPKETGEIKKELYQVKNVELADASDGKKELRLSGKGLPNSFVTIYVYSELPIILTVKTDENGNWSYVLDKQVENGEHQVYVAVTDNTGKITAKSDPLFFVKTAEAATIIPSAEASTAMAAAAAPAEKRRLRDLAVIAGIIILGFIAALTTIGFYIIHANKKTKGLA